MSWKKILVEGDAATLSDTNPQSIQVQTASPGSGLSGSREDHLHAVSTAAPAAITVGATQAEGSATSLARSDHIHQSPSTWTPSSHATAHKSGGGDALALDELAVPTGNVSFNKKQATSLALEVLSSAPASPVNGQVYFNDTDDHAYVYVG